jgi:mannose-6-phosphate isomerase-like protein (cupin superfamily)
LAHSQAEPVIVLGSEAGQAGSRIEADGASFGIHEWRGSGPAYLHVHHADDEAWHVLEGVVRFKFSDREVEAGPGSTIFVPAGVAHSYEVAGAARYLTVLTPRLREMIAELQTTRDLDEHRAIMRRYQSEVLE